MRYLFDSPSDTLYILYEMTLILSMRCDASFILYELPL